MRCSIACLPACTLWHLHSLMLSNMQPAGICSRRAHSVSQKLQLVARARNDSTHVCTILMQVSHHVTTPCVQAVSPTKPTVRNRSSFSLSSAMSPPKHSCCTAMMSMPTPSLIAGTPLGRSMGVLPTVKATVVPRSALPWIPLLRQSATR